MKRLDFRLHDFTRVTWASSLAETVWHPKMKQVTAAWLRLEWLSVVHGIRKVAVTMVTPQGFIDQAAEWAEHGLSGVPVEMIGETGSYKNDVTKAELGRPFVFRVVIGRPDDIAAFAGAWKAQDDGQIAKFLGYPDCCADFFCNTWVEQGLIDTTWDMAASTCQSGDENFIQVSSLPEANILWRWVGIRAVPHLPCSFDCPKTVEIAKRYINLGYKLGYGQEMDCLLEILSWPVEWSALHGIAEIRTPILKVSTRTDATADKCVVRKTGVSYPKEGAKGLTFPYTTGKLVLSESRGFNRGIENPIESKVEPVPSWYASDNGFSSRFGMDQSHKPIVEFIKQNFPHTQGNILDLGCGNGVLLRKLCAENDGLIPFGLDIVQESIEHAAQMLSRYGDNFVVGKIETIAKTSLSSRSYEVALIMPGRIIEMSSDERIALFNFLQNHVQHIVVYAYGDWLTKCGGLEGLAEEADLEVISCDGGVGIASVAKCLTNLIEV